MGDDTELLDAFVLQPGVHRLQILQRVELQGDLVDDVVLHAGRPAGDQDDLVVLVGIVRQEAERVAAGDLALVHDQQAEHARVEVLHTGQIGDVDSQMTEDGGRGGHGDPPGRGLTRPAS